MKFSQRLVVYYLIATIFTMFFVGLAVLKGVQILSMDTIEQQLIDQSKLAEMYISQIAFLDNPDADELSEETSNKIITNLGLVLGKVRIYDRNLNKLATSERSSESENIITADDNNKVLTNALKGNYAYLTRDNTVFFCSPLNVQGKTIGLLEIIYPMDFLSTLIHGVTNILLVGAVAFAVLLTLLSIYIAGRVTKPIKQLVSAAENFSNRDFTPVAIKGSREIAQLCKSFNAMGNELKEYIHRQKLFVSNVSHELRTPLTAIKGYSEYLADEVIGKPDLEKAVYHLNTESARLTRLVEEVLTLSSIDSDRVVFNFEKIDFTSLVSKTIDKMLLRADKYEVLLQKELKQNIYLSGDVEKLIQVLVNLLDNAIKFSPPHSLVWIRLYSEKTAVKLEIEDRGIGIAPEDCSKVFERFYRGKNSRGVSGTGLGLSIVKHIVDAHKGTIELTPASDGGTKAILTLPAGL